MEDDERAGQAGFGRTLALSDGIFAIAMTLVAFQIQAPTLRHGQSLAHALASQGDSYYVFALTFFVIGAFWMGHHRLYARLKRVDDRLMSINLLFLAGIAILPFPSGVLGRYGGQSVAVILYAGNMIVVGALLGYLTLAARSRHLLLPSMDEVAVRRALWRSGLLIIIFAVSIPVAVVWPKEAPFLWLAMFPARLVFRLAVNPLDTSAH